MISNLPKRAEPLRFSASFELSDLPYSSKAASSASKSAQNSASFRSQSYRRADFWRKKENTAGNMWILSRCLTHLRHKSAADNQVRNHCLRLGNAPQKLSQSFCDTAVGGVCAYIVTHPLDFVRGIAHCNRNTCILQHFNVICAVTH